MHCNKVNVLLFFTASYSLLFQLSTKTADELEEKPLRGSAVPPPASRWNQLLPFQRNLRTQGSLRLVSTNVQLNSSSYYLQGEKQRTHSRSLRRKRHTGDKHKHKQQHQSVGEQTSSTSTRFHLVFSLLISLVTEGWVEVSELPPHFTVEASYF